ncbi:hypothetical protein [Vibrio agarivorans]|uniref:Uncharacterized protein n=1 Tax=Vibrio agarivorans TaxID=153622 RepID=A0ABT7Y7R4_9VIBR|nr:hypothetical protein [Vibrio agarivorans]MDN2484010.1 hypothetical protein [Vibrio agarivorans]
MKHETLTVEGVAEKLKDTVCESYQWPNVPEEGYHIEFIQHPDGTLILDFLNQEKAMFWSEAADEVIQTPIKTNGQPITWQDLKSAGIPFMS